jgi:hypothetical protein
MGDIISQMGINEEIQTLLIDLSEIYNIKKLFDIKKDIVLN